MSQLTFLKKYKKKKKYGQDNRLSDAFDGNSFTFYIQDSLILLITSRTKMITKKKTLIDIFDITFYSQFPDSFESLLCVRGILATQICNTLLFSHLFK